MINEEQGPTAKKERAVDLLLSIAADQISREDGGEYLLDSISSSGEKAVMSYIKCLMLSGANEIFSPLPYHAQDKTVFEMQMRHGRADIVIFHIDGSVSVIEVKDGDRDVMAVVGGIGQVGLYAGQLAVSRTFPKVRRALMWTACPNSEHTGLVIDACRIADVHPLLLPSASKIKQMMSQVIVNRALDGLRAAGEWMQQHGTKVR